MRMRLPLSCVISALLTFAGTAAHAQTIASSASGTGPGNADAMQLSPFQVVAEDDRSYQAANTLGATRTNVAIRDLPMQNNVVTEQLMVVRSRRAL
jgi:hypothetical protein